MCVCCFKSPPLLYREYCIIMEWFKGIFISALTQFDTLGYTIYLKIILEVATSRCLQLEWCVICAVFVQTPAEKQVLFPFTCRKTCEFSAQNTLWILECSIYERFLPSLFNCVRYIGVIRSWVSGCRSGRSTRRHCGQKQTCVLGFVTNQKRPLWMTPLSAVPPLTETLPRSHLQLWISFERLHGEECLQTIQQSKL